MLLRHWLLLPYKLIRVIWLILVQYGWLASYARQRSTGTRGRPVPWYSYSAIEYLDSFDWRKARVFEYGCGNSSRFWAARAHVVHAAENDEAWAAKVNAFGLANLRIHHASDKEMYLRTPISLGGEFDVVVIDGRFRHACVAVAIAVVAPGGVVVLDNADWYPDACAALRRNGWFQIDFSGLGPINAYCTRTSVFVRADVRLTRREPAPRPIGALDLLGDPDD
jgi:hypothetical protein